MSKSYIDMLAFDSFEERFEYLKLSGTVGKETFGYDRYLNQQFYKTMRWKKVRDAVIIRDSGCDLGCLDRPINSSVVVHHIQPISEKDIYHNREILYDMNNLISTTAETHRAIHYGNIQLLAPSKPLIRRPNDQSPWRQ